MLDSMPKYCELKGQRWYHTCGYKWFHHWQESVFIDSLPLGIPPNYFLNYKLCNNHELIHWKCHGLQYTANKTLPFYEREPAQANEANTCNW